MLVTPDGPVHPWDDFTDLGLLWALNAHALNPRGYHMGVWYPDDTFVGPVGFQLVGSGREPFRMPAQSAKVGAEKFRARFGP